MARQPNQDISTFTVTESWPVSHPDGSTALAFQVRGLGTIAFLVDAQSIAAIRKGLADCEALLSRPPGRA